MKLSTSIVFASALFASALGLPAQSLITSATTTSSKVGAASAEGATFNGNVSAISQFTAGGTTYNFTGLADSAYIRRSTTATSLNHSSVWYASSGANFTGVHENDYGALLLGNTIYSGSDNTFANGTADNTGNIERLDFVFTGGLTATADLAFSVWDRGAIGVHDGFKIAVITGWDTTNKVPTSYAQLNTASPSWGGTTDPLGAMGYRLFRYNQGDNISDDTSRGETGTQNLGGLVFSMADLDVTPGTTIYGYSLFGYDVTDAGNTTNLLNWTNSTYFPTSTTGATGSGGIDLASINGAVFVQVPEPATYAALLGLFTLALVALRRR